jgi:hypothetical protein
MSRRDITLAALALAATSAALYGLHYAIFGNAHHIFIYLLGDLAFLPLQVLFVTVIVDRLLSSREQRSRQYKMQMVIGAFFSAVGQPLLKLMGGLVANCAEVSAGLCVGPQWTEKDLREAVSFLARTELRVDPEPNSLAAVRDLLASHRDFLLGLLENPTLLEHETFTDLLWAIFHLEEELLARQSLEGLPEPDRKHLATDAKRAFSALLSQWLQYMIHLRRDYPYLFSFAARTNPLRPDARAEVVA